MTGWWSRGCCATRGRDVDVLLLAAPDELRGDALTNSSACTGPPARPFDPAALAGAGAIVDAILGTGFAGEPRDPARGAIEAINAAAADALVIACDVPSGVDGSTGEVAGAAVRAAATATFHAGKPGLWIAPGKAHAGEVTVVDIGIPAGAPVQARHRADRGQRDRRDPAARAGSRPSSRPATCSSAAVRWG